MSSTSGNNTQVDAETLERWKTLFGYDDQQAKDAVLLHRKDPFVHVSDEDWAWVRQGHERAGFDREAYEHLHMMKTLVSRYHRKVKARNLRMYEHVGDYARISLEGYFTLDILTQMLGEEEIGTVDSAEKWCYINDDQANRRKMSSWVDSVTEALARSKSSYNEVWKAIIKEASDTSLSRAGFHAGPRPQNSDIHVNFLKLDYAQPEVFLEQAGGYLTLARSPTNLHQLRKEFSIADLERSRPSRPRRTLPISQLPASAMNPVMPPRNLIGMRRFLRDYRTYPDLRLPKFGNAPRLLTVSEKVVTAQPRRCTVRNTTNSHVARPHPVNMPPSTSGTQQQSKPPDSTQSKPPDSTESSTTYEDRRRRQEQLRKRRTVLHQDLAEKILSRGKANCMKAFHGFQAPRTASDMIVRQLVLAKHLAASSTIAMTDFNIASDASETWSQFMRPSVQV
ncbi:hypothetical protein WAI453_011819 [Rhynchosporium graminicola]